MNDTLSYEPSPKDRRLAADHARIIMRSQIKKTRQITIPTRDNPTTVNKRPDLKLVPEDVANDDAALDAAFSGFENEGINETGIPVENMLIEQQKNLKENKKGSMKTDSEIAKREASIAASMADIKIRRQADEHKRREDVLKKWPDLNPQEAARIARREASMAEMSSDIRETQRLDDEKRREKIKKKFNIE